MKKITVALALGFSVISAQGFLYPLSLHVRQKKMAGGPYAGTYPFTKATIECANGTSTTTTISGAMHDFNTKVPITKQEEYTVIEAQPKDPFGMSGMGEGMLPGMDEGMMGYGAGSGSSKRSVQKTRTVQLKDAHGKPAYTKQALDSVKRVTLQTDDGKFWITIDQVSAIKLEKRQGMSRSTDSNTVYNFIYNVLGFGDFDPVSDTVYNIYNVLGFDYFDPVSDDVGAVGSGPVCHHCQRSTLFLVSTNLYGIESTSSNAAPQGKAHVLGATWYEENNWPTVLVLDISSTGDVVVSSGNTQNTRIAYI